MSTLTEQESADAYCRFLATRHYENFNVASRILPPELRLHLARLYAYARTTDDFGDESGEHGTRRLDRWEAQVNALFRGEHPVHPVLLALQPTIERFAIPPDPFIDLIGANRQDQTVNSYPTWESLRRYCRLSAAPVGRMVLRVFEVPDPAAVPLSDDVCIGLQLANFAQDVSIDRRRGRSYLIGEEIETAGLRGATRLLCDRAEALLGSGRTLEQMVPPRLALQLALYRRGGLAIIGAVRGLGYRTDERRPTVDSRAKLALIPRAVLETVRRSEHVPARRTA